jgi:hypothetical protein
MFFSPNPPPLLAAPPANLKIARSMRSGPLLTSNSLPSTVSDAAIAVAEAPNSDPSLTLYIGVSGFSHRRIKHSL